DRELLSLPRVFFGHLPAVPVTFLNDRFPIVSRPTVEI
ncbi:MAG: hypothetical protein ACI822_002790, partial [Gammaproteobacteria bacterium]